MQTAILLKDGQYVDAAVQAMQAARIRLHCSMFLVEGSDSSGHVTRLLDSAADAHWRGVETRVVLAEEREVLDMVLMSVGARAVLDSLGVPTRWLTAAPVRGSHAKILVADDTSIVGSHNWTEGAMSGDQRQESLMLDSSGIATQLSAVVLAQWRRAGEFA